MLKLLQMVLIAVLIAAPASPALAKVQSFDVYTVDVPTDWTITNQDDIVTLVSPDRNNVFFITQGLSIPKHKEKIAQTAAQFDYIIKAAPKKISTMMPIQGNRIAVTIWGDHLARTKIYYSIKERR